MEKGSQIRLDGDVIIDVTKCNFVTSGEQPIPAALTEKVIRLLGQVSSIDNHIINVSIFRI